LDSHNKLDVARIHLDQETRKKILKMEKKKRIHKTKEGIERNEMQRHLIYRTGNKRKKWF